MSTPTDLHTDTALHTDTTPHTDTALVAQLRNVHAGYGPNTVLKGLDLDIVRGEQLVLVGPRGAGKSTALRVLTEQLHPSSGHVSFPAGRPRSAVAGQAPLLFDWLTVAENVRLGKRFRTRVPAVERGDEAVDLLGLHEHADSHRADLTDEQALRASLARALSTESDLLLLDEPFAGLDDATRARAQVWLRDLLVTDGLTSVIVTDSWDEALALGDRIVVLGACGRVLTTLNLTTPTTPELVSV